MDDSNESPAKRVKVTPVVFLWNLPRSADEEKISVFCHPFGDVVEILYLERKSQALVQMESPEAAQRLIDRYERTEPLLDNKPIRITFSKKEYITPKYDNQERSENRHSADWGLCRVLMVSTPGIDKYTHQQDVMHLVSECHLEPSTYTLTKTLVVGAKHLAFVEFATPEGAMSVFQTMQSRNVYLNNQQVKFFKAKRDFIDGGNEVRRNPPREHAREEYHGRSHNTRSPPPRAGRARYIPGDIPPMVLEDARAIGVPLEALTMVPAVKTADGPILFEEYYAKRMRASERGRYDRDDYVQRRRPPQLEADDRDNRDNRRGRVVMISGLSVEVQDCDKLQSLCGAFGDVRRTKLSFKNRDVAFVEMEDMEGARRAVDYLQDMFLWNRKLDIKISNMPKLEGIPNKTNENNEVLTKDYYRSMRNRYHGKEKLRKNIHPPGTILHLSNLAIKAVKEFGKQSLERELSEMFGGKEVQFLSNSETQLFCLAGSREESVRILVEHHLEDFHGRPLRVSFSQRSDLPDPS